MHRESENSKKTKKHTVKPDGGWQPRKKGVERRGEAKYRKL
jgi:hypothetical protein